MCNETENVYTSFQNDLDRLLSWSVKWEMKFNVDECKVMHFGNKKINTNKQSLEKHL